MKKEYKVGDWVQIAPWLAPRIGSTVVKIVRVYSKQNFGVVGRNGKHSFLRVENIVEKYKAPVHVPEHKLMEVLHGC